MIIEIYQNRNKKWHWRMKRKGRIVDDSGEGYNRKPTMLRTLNGIIASIKSSGYKLVDLSLPKK